MRPAHVDMADDAWAAWLACGRTGGDPQRAAAIAAEAAGYAREILARVPLAAGDVLVDAGCGEGLVGRAALQRAGVHVWFCDASAPLVERARAAVADVGALDRASFAVTDVVTLDPLPDASVDAVAIRSVLAYVPDRAAAFAAMWRVLRPGGRISIFEPVLRDAAFRLTAMRSAIVHGDPDLELLHRWHALGLPDTVDGIRAHPLTNYDERTLFQLAIAAGFGEVHVRLELDQCPVAPIPWAVALAVAPVPGMPTLATALAEHYTPDERQRFESRFRPLFENGSFPSELRAGAYLWARKPEVSETPP